MISVVTFHNSFLICFALANDGNLKLHPNGTLCMQVGAVLLLNNLFSQLTNFCVWLFCNLPALVEFARGCAAHTSQHLY